MISKTIPPPGNKIIREAISTMGIINALEQAAKGVDDFDLEIPTAVVERATTTVTCHTAVALCGRPPQSVTLKSCDSKLHDTPESVRLRKMMLRMQGAVVSGTEM